MSEIFSDTPELADEERSADDVISLAEENLIAKIESRYPEEERIAEKFRITLKTVSQTDGIGFTLPDDEDEELPCVTGTLDCRVAPADDE